VAGDAGRLLGQAAAFVLFRYFDAAKPGPVRWADRLFKLQPGRPSAGARASASCSTTWWRRLHAADIAVWVAVWRS
jgi:hypothetical protein